MRRRIAHLILAGSLAAGVGSVSAVAVVACSCVMPEPMEVHRGDPLKTIFSGRVASIAGDGVVVAVEEWFQGGSEPAVRLAPDGFGTQSAACQESLPLVGSRWIYVAFTPKPGDSPQVNLCTPKAALDTDQGQAMLAEARKVFGPGLIPEVDDPEVAGPAPTASPIGLAAVAGGVVLAVIGLFGAVVLLGRRRAG
jgi:hypothetical protein